MEAPDDRTPEPADGSGQVSRKTVLRAALAAGVALPIGLMSGPALARTATATPPLTPMCDDGDDPTPPQMEGPYFKPNSPRRTSLVTPGMPGTPLSITGYVFGLSCQPLANVLLDFWQADNSGAYDNVGYRLRGHQFTTAKGAYTLTTIVPGLYPGRTRHVHVKVQAPGRPVLTTQLYFPGEPGNGSDPIYDPRLVMTVRNAGDGREAEFDFVLNVPAGTDPPDEGTWAEGTSYTAGDQVTYAGRTYVCLQGHVALPGWEPPAAPALWRAA